MKKLLAITALLILAGCSSGDTRPTTDICIIKKHWKDNVFQVQINGTPISKHWYIYDDAVEIARTLAKNNKCMK